MCHVRWCGRKQASAEVQINGETGLAVLASIVIMCVKWIDGSIPARDAFDHYPPLFTARLLGSRKDAATDRLGI